ncbi:MAG: YciI family protein [Deltaproteobacteria bacterium]|nr:YciI family protein [Deltaproteobacteria bacterium]
MRVMVIVKATKNSEAGILPGDPRAPEGFDELFEKMGKFNEELVDAGLMLAGDGLKPSSEGKRVRFSGSERKVLDGPFAATKELVAGYWIWQVKSMDEALEWARRCPNPMPGEDSELEIRPVYEPEDFPAEVAEQDARLRDSIDARK